MIRRCFRLLFLVSACFILAGVHNVLAEEDVENLIQNADFEDFGVEPWTMWIEDNAVVATMEIDKNEGLMGSQSLLIDISTKGSGQRVELHQRHFQLEKGQQLTYAFWAKTEEDGVVPAKMIANHRADPWTSYGSKAITITDEWTEFWTPVVMTADDDIVGIYVELRDTPSLVWFDHFRLYEGEYIEEDLEGMPERAVQPHSKLASTWAAVKAPR
jgi:hypothetical protein